MRCIDVTCSSCGSQPQDLIVFVIGNYRLMAIAQRSLLSQGLSAPTSVNDMRPVEPLTLKEPPMKARTLHITERSRERVSMPLSLNDFTTTDGGEIDADFIINNSSVSLCCLDDANRRAIFAELPAGVDPAQAPFVYQAQFDHAQRLLAVRYDDLPALAQQVEPVCSRFVFIHNIGRCGSTLLHNAFSKVKEAVSLSEPDVLGQIHYQRAADGSRDAELVSLMQNCLPLLFKSASHPSAEVGIVKLRNQCMDDIDLFWQAFPNAQHFFLYRSPVGWVGSIYARHVRRNAPLTLNTVEAHAKWESYHNRPIHFEEYGLEDLSVTISLAEQLTISWLIMMERHLHFYRNGMQMPALRYEELNARKNEALEALFGAIKLPKRAVDDALAAFGEDSQAGTRLARPDPTKGTSLAFSGEQLAQMQKVLQQHGDINTLEYLAPGTMMLG